jgi:hypothetical protein
VVKKLLWAAAMGILAATVMIGRAEASLFLNFTPAQAPPGSLVEARTAGSAAFDPIPAPDQFPRVYMETSKGRILLGTLVVDERGVGTIRFTVPEVSLGRHRITADCPTCRPLKTALQLGTLTVSASSTQQDGTQRPSKESGPTTDEQFDRWWWLAAVTVASGLIAGTLVFARRGGLSRRP